ncbi:MAG: threonine/serine exporter family protein [Bacteroidales bacterium]|nr:threonine/serine exporter family protein [Bacteroidales bacterium]
MERMETNRDILDLAGNAGRTLLENGAEIARVEETMSRIAHHYGAEDDSFFVLSNGIIATGQDYARASFIPIKGTSLDKVVAVNQLSREVIEFDIPLAEARHRLDSIRTMKRKPNWEQVLGSSIGGAAFCLLFGGSMTDCFASLVAGLVLACFVSFVSTPYLSRIASNVLGGLIASLSCLCLYRCGVGDHLSNIIIGTLIALVPGVPFTNGIRDLANEDYIAGTTRLLDAMLIFFCIALGLCLALMLDARLTGGLVELSSMTVDAFTSRGVVQVLAALIGTAGFAVLFGVPRRYYVDCGVCGAVGWAVYLLLTRSAHLTVVEATVVSATVVAMVSRLQAVWRKCPVTVFLICGIFPLVPGAGIFWTSYHLVAGHLVQAVSTGFLAVKITVAIALGIILAYELYGRRAHKRSLRRKLHTS